MHKIKSKKSLVLRGWLISIFFLLWALIILFFMFRINIKQGDKLEKFTEQNNFRLNLVPAERGDLYSSNGDLLATSIVKHNIHVDWSVVNKNLFDSNIKILSDSLSHIFNKPYQHFYKKFKREKNKNNRYMLLAKGLDYNLYKRISQFPIFKKGQNKGGFIHDTELKREILVKDIGLRTIGYDDNRGKVGLEGTYSSYLKGVDGTRWEQFMGRGMWKPMKKWENKPISGYSVYTTIDLDLQMFAYEALNKQLIDYEASHGCVVVMEVSTGKIRAIVNLTKSKTGDYIDNYNYAIGEASEPGSTFKVISLLACMDDGYINKNFTINTGNGSCNLYGRTIRDTKSYGLIKLKDIIIKSSNIGTAKTINKFYFDKPYNFIKKLDKWGITKKLNIDIIGEGSPQFIKPNSKNWSNIALPVMSYGYGIKLTPIHILTFYNAIANKGVMVKPLFIDKITKKGEKDKFFHSQIIVNNISSYNIINEMNSILQEVVSKGTAKIISNPYYNICGKTGTVRVEYWKDKDIKYQSSFVGYFPSNKPEYSCIVVINKPNKLKGYYGANVAAPVFKKISDWIYYKSPVYLKHNEYYRNSILKLFSCKNNKLVINNKIPNLIGLNGKDVIFSLENKGIKVKYTGLGVVKRQSIEPGTIINRNQVIYLELYQ